jgi:myo-inositol-1(or 4)-monophosphatase
MTDLKNICSEIEKAAHEAGEFIRHESERFEISMTETKGLNNFVSYVDKGSEKMLVERLGELLPEAGFLTEEGTIEKTGIRYCWVIDPLDGTTNFLHGLPPYAISIGLMEYDEVIAGVVYDVRGQETFTAWKGGGAWLNGKPIHVSKAPLVADSLIATGFPYTDFERLEKFMGTLTHFCKHSHGIRRFGSAAIDLAYVACGRVEVFYEYGLHPWDIAAGVILVREAGGFFSDFSGNEKNLTGDDVVATNGLIGREVLEIIGNYMGNKTN